MDDHARLYMISLLGVREVRCEKLKSMHSTTRGVGGLFSLLAGSLWESQMIRRVRRWSCQSGHEAISVATRPTLTLLRLGKSPTLKTNTGSA